jgi:biopolymer transport protein ExbD
MSWKVRHEGSPKAVEGLTLQQVVDGLTEGQWEATDEVRGPNDTEWKRFEDHPQFAEAAAELAAPPEYVYDDEGHIDLNALIDVCLVLLIVFILTTTAAAMQSRLRSPDVDPKDDKQEAIAIVQDDEVDRTMVRVNVTMSGGKPVIKIENKETSLSSVEEELKKIVRNSKKSILLLDVDRKAPVSIALSIQRDAESAGMKEVKRVVPD